jgi:diguanylate cyclase (GGDEF)-like protein/PAS domain S-box-containing protein
MSDRQGIDGPVAAQRTGERGNRSRPSGGFARGRDIVADVDWGRYAFERATVGITIVDLQGRYLRVNHALAATLGYDPEELIGRTWQEITHPDDLEADLTAVSTLLAGELDGYEMEKRYIHRDGRVVWIALSVSLVRDDAGHPLFFVGQVIDITERKRVEEQLVYQAFHDPLTGLPNRALFSDRVNHALARAQRGSETIGILFLDLDNFKVINDSLGHRAGDQLLVTMGERLQASVRPSDTVARLGGDEFTVLLEGINGIADAIRVAQRISEQSLTLYTIGDRQVAVTASIGIALSSSDTSESADDLLRNADTAMYEAKRRGRSRFEVYEPRMSARARERFEMEIALQRALERGEFVLHYQPIVDLSTGRLTEVEALIRWQSPERGLLLPEAFLPVAEETGIIVALGDWVMMQGCRQLRAWHLMYPSDPRLVLTVNLSTRQFLRSSLVDDVRAVLASSGIPPETLKLEISERVVMEDVEVSTDILRGLKNLGVTLAIDDFGTGYSSLPYLRRFDVDILKIDRSFVAGIGANIEQTAIVDAIIAIAKTLGIAVTAEGVETAAQLSHLQAHDAECAQGIFFHPPTQPSGIDELLRIGWRAPRLEQGSHESRDTLHLMSPDRPSRANTAANDTRPRWTSRNRDDDDAIRTGE